MPEQTLDVLLINNLIKGSETSNGSPKSKMQAKIDEMIRSIRSPLKMETPPEPQTGGSQRGNVEQIID